MTDELKEGAVLRGKYRIQRVIGRGGMGRVLEAFHLDLERRVAIKTLHPELRSNAEIVERFLREGRAASRIEGEHVARILDVDRLEDGTPYLVMEFLEGWDLSVVRRSKEPLPFREAIDYIVQACSALSKAHARGIVHRDIKPANLFLARQEDGTCKVKVLDFGISKVNAAASPDSGEGSMTKTNLVMGSAEFMSPEQMLSARDVDGRTDIWALGVVLYELLTAKPPFPGETLPQVCALIMSKPPVSPRALRPEIPEAVEQVVMRCLKKDREERYENVEALVTALRATLASTDPGLGGSAAAPLSARAGELQQKSAPPTGSSALPIHPAPFAAFPAAAVAAGNAAVSPTPVPAFAGAPAEGNAPSGTSILSGAPVVPFTPVNQVAPRPKFSPNATLPLPAVPGDPACRPFPQLPEMERREYAAEPSLPSVVGPTAYNTDGGPTNRTLAGDPVVLPKKSSIPLFLGLAVLVALGIGGFAYGSKTKAAAVDTGLAATDEPTTIIATTVTATTTATAVVPTSAKTATAVKAPITGSSSAVASAPSAAVAKSVAAKPAEAPVQRPIERPAASGGTTTTKPTSRPTTITTSGMD
ncbi:MAG: protein kinase [Polyangiaceae bacterium]